MEKIEFRKENGPITIEVSSGYASLGSFMLAYCKKESYNFIEFGRDPKRIDDEIKDIHPIPINLEMLSDYQVVIIGKYSPLPSKKQIKVTYSFIQNNEVIHTTPIEETTEEYFKRYTHWYEFKQLNQ